MKCRNCIIWKNKLRDNRYVKDAYVASGVYSLLDNDKIKEQDRYFKENEEFLISVSDKECPVRYCLLVKENADNSR